MKVYLVGGAVRDRLLEIPFIERDWVVVGATEQQMLDQGYVPLDSKFPVFLHPQTRDEYALARRETKTGPGYKGFSVDCSPDVTLEEDLLRRDLTINAMAQDEQGRIIDPYHGQEDLEAGLLRHVSPAFVEDPVRLLRIARFAAKLGRWGFRVVHTTHGLMKRMAVDEDLYALPRSRLWREMRRAMETDQPWRFFQVLSRCGALQHLLPLLDRKIQQEAGHDERQDDSAMRPLKLLSALEKRPEARFACVFFQALNGQPADILDLPMERTYLELITQAQRLAIHFDAPLRADAEGMLSFLEQGRALQHPGRFQLLITTLGALFPKESEIISKRYQEGMEIIRKISGESVREQGYQGVEIGKRLRTQRLDQLQRLLSQ